MCASLASEGGGIYVSVLARGWHVRVCACTCMCVSYVEGGMYVGVLPRGWHVCVCLFPMWRVVCTYVSYLEDSMYVCLFPMWRVVCTVCLT